MLGLISTMTFNYGVEWVMWFEGGLYMVVALLPWKYIYIPMLF
jgi:hypothetical protein